MSKRLKKGTTGRNSKQQRAFAVVKSTAESNDLSKEDEALLTEYESVMNDPKALSALFVDKGAGLRGLIVKLDGPRLAPVKPAEWPHVTDNTFLHSLGWGVSAIRKLVSKFEVKLDWKQIEDAFWDAATQRDEVLKLPGRLGSADREIRLRFRLVLDKFLSDRSRADYWALRYHAAGGTVSRKIKPGGVDKARPDRSDHDRMRYSAEVIAALAKHHGFPNVTAAAIKKSRQRLGLKN